jgi:hypothetical protein
MGVIIVPSLVRVKDPDIVPPPDLAARLPIRIDRNHDSGRYRQNFHWYARPVIQPVLILIVDENVVPRMAFVPAPVEKIIPLGFVPVSPPAADGMRGVPPQGEMKPSLSLPVSSPGILSLEQNLQLPHFLLSFSPRRQPIPDLRVQKVPSRGRVRGSPKKGWDKR